MNILSVFRCSYLKHFKSITNQVFKTIEKLNMKIIFLSFSLLMLPLSSSIMAQNTELKQKANIKSELRFLPNSISDLTVYHSGFSFRNTSKQNIFLARTGYLLQDLKFSSPIDRFNATAPFDIRGFEPTTFSNYSNYIKTNYLLLKPIQSIK